LAASEQGNLSIFQYLISLKADIHGDQEKALLIASKFGNNSIVEYILT